MTSKASHCGNSEPAALLRQFQAIIPKRGPGRILDLACGGGRNGLLLARAGLPVTFVDINSEALSQINEIAHLESLDIQTKVFDLEQGLSLPWQPEQFSVVMIFNYLYRPLMSQLKDLVCPGGLFIYETFHVEQATIARPRNPDFLLKSGELAQEFSGWKIHHQFEGALPAPQRFVSQIVAEKT